MKIKSKITFGVFSLFAIIMIVGGVGIYYLHLLGEDAKNIIRNNYETLYYTNRILGAADSLRINDEQSISTMQQYRLLQESNVTEPGEDELTIALGEEISKLITNPSDSISYLRLRQHIISIQDLNMRAIFRKNEQAQLTAKNATTYLILIGSIFGIMAFTFILNFPSYVADPIVQLTNSIQAIANKNYEERLHFDRKDEFEELAQAFNQMAEKLDEYEHSNLANILFEKKRIETIINRISDPILGLDEKNMIVFANDQTLQLLNLTADKLMGRYAPDVALENDLLRNLIRSDAQVEKQHLLKVVLHGKENYFSKEKIAILYTPTGEKESVPLGHVIILRNVTSYKELDLAKTNFIATISHELKTPIASLQMCGKLLNDTRIGTLNDEQNKVVETLMAESNRLSKLVNELLDLSQVETGNIKLKLEALNPLLIVDQAIESIKFQAERKNITIERIVPDSLVSIKADRDKTTWVMLNLLTNALRHSAEDSKLIVQLIQTSATTRFVVTDFGTGIDEKYLSHVFDKFFQVPGSTQGTGLGLAISKEFIEAQNGTIGVTSKMGSGSSFTFELPC
ncbi:MAG: HAMP domain-containing protein [Cytophagia bacterium]|nr:HAMP domain-containing protein [Cytophagia bacterium]